MVGLNLGDYPEDFTNRLDYVCSDLSVIKSLKQIEEHDDMTFFLSVPPERYADAVVNLKKAGKLNDPETSRVVIENPLGTILNLLIIYSQWWAQIYAKNKYIALTIILAKILLIIYLLLGLVIPSFGTTLEP